MHAMMMVIILELLVDLLSHLTARFSGTSSEAYCLWVLSVEYTQSFIIGGMMKTNAVILPVIPQPPTFKSHSSYLLFFFFFTEVKQKKWQY